MPLKLESETPADGVLVVVAEGEIDANTFEFLEAALSDGIEAGRPRLVIDLAAVNFVSSSGIGILIGAKTEAVAQEGDLVLAAPQDSVREVFDGMGFSAMFTISPTREEALATYA